MNKQYSEPEGNKYNPTIRPYVKVYTFKDTSQRLLKNKPLSRMDRHRADVAARRAQNLRHP